MLKSLYLPLPKALMAFLVSCLAMVTAFIWTPHETLPACLILAVGLSWASAIDVDRMKLPNVLTLGLVAAGFAMAAITRRPSVLESSIGASAGYASLWLVAQLYRRVRNRDGLGLGDAKLFAAGGAWVGWELLPVAMLIASAAALVTILGALAFRMREALTQPMAFGPFIAFGIWIAWLVSMADCLSVA